MLTQQTAFAEYELAESESARITAMAYLTYRRFYHLRKIHRLIAVAECLPFPLTTRQTLALEFLSRWLQSEFYVSTKPSVQVARSAYIACAQDAA